MLTPRDARGNYRCRRNGGTQYELTAVDGGWHAHEVLPMRGRRRGTGRRPLKFQPSIARAVLLGTCLRCLCGAAAWNRGTGIVLRGCSFWAWPPVISPATVPNWAII